MTNLPQICWDEALSHEESLRICDEIMAALTTPLSKQHAGNQTLYFLVPTPTPYKAAEAEFLAAATAAGSSPQNFRTLAFPHGGKFYAAADQRLFKALLSPAFHLGPPELTLIAAHCHFGLLASANDIVEFVLAVLKDRANTQAGEFVGMHFDSGDLVEIFGST